MVDFIPVSEPLFNGNEKKYLAECIDTGWISSEGPFVHKFEQEMAAFVGRKYGIAVCNGSAALEASIAALELRPGDEVIMPTFTIISCAAAVVRRGCTPVLVDSDHLTWNMDVSQIEAKITSRTRAIMVVHMYGLPVDMDHVMKLAHTYGLKVIEDAAQMHGQTYKKRNCGSFGNISIFSFYANKHITTGEGGMVLTDDAYLAERSRSLRNLCFKKEKRFIHDELGYNFRMTNIQAAVGLAQLEQLAEFVVHKRHMGDLYSRLLSKVPGIQLPLERTDSAENIYWVYGLLLTDDVPWNAEEAIKRLSQAGIGARPFFWPMHEQPVFHKMGLFAGERYPVAERLARKGFYLPSGSALTDKQIQRAALALNEVMR
jgi:perosamine synthetase